MTLCRLTLCRVSDRLSFDPRSFDPRSFDPMSFDPMSFDPRSFDPMSVNPLFQHPRQEEKIKVRIITRKNFQQKYIRLKCKKWEWCGTRGFSKIGIIIDFSHKILDRNGPGHGLHYNNMCITRVDGGWAEFWYCHFGNDNLAMTIW